MFNLDGEGVALRGCDDHPSGLALEKEGIGSGPRGKRCDIPLVNRELATLIKLQRQRQVEPDLANIRRQCGEVESHRTIVFQFAAQDRTVAIPGRKFSTLNRDPGRHRTLVRGADCGIAKREPPSSTGIDHDAMLGQCGRECPSVWAEGADERYKNGGGVASGHGRCPVAVGNDGGQARQRRARRDQLIIAQ